MIPIFIKYKKNYTVVGIKENLAPVIKIKEDSMILKKVIVDK